VLVFEHKHLYRSTRGPVAFDPNYRSVWRPKKIRAGTTGTIVTYGEMVHLTASAVDYLNGEYGFTFDVFDLRALSPLDLGPIKESLKNTHQLGVIHEGRRTCGFGAELVTRLVSEHFHDMDGPPLRIASLDTPVPFATELEAAYRPSVESITESIINWLE
jgi:2-oxoisovalerate dehydrogenase E1 component